MRDCRLGNYDARKRMLRFLEACNGCSFYFLVSSMKNFLAKTVFASCYLKLSPPMVLKCFLIFAQFQPHVSYRPVSYKQNVYTDPYPSKLMLEYVGKMHSQRYI